jgi:hypothetical protein
MYDFSAANELESGKRFGTGTPGNYLPTDGGVILPGVAPDGTTNTVRANANIYANAWGYARALINYTFMMLDISIA